jgi:hypothetical protein
MKTFNYIGVTLSIIFAVAMFFMLIAWGVSLPATALLWINGALSGWVELLLVATCGAAICLLPLPILLDDITSGK